MQPHVRVREQEGANGLGFMRREIVGDHVNRSPLRLTGHDVAEEFDKGGAGVPRHGLAEDLARLCVQRREERQRAVPVVLEAVALRASRRERQHRIEAVERLNGRFLVHGEDRRVVRRIDIQANHVGGLRLEVGIVRLHVALEAVGLEARALPRLRDEVVMNLQHASQLPGTPVRTAVGRWLLGLGQHTRFHRRGQHRRRLPAVARAQPLETGRQKTPAPAIDVIAVARHRGFDRRVRFTISEHQNHPSPAPVFSPNLEASHAAFQLGSFIGRQCQRHMAPNSTSTASVSTSH